MTTILSQSEKDEAKQLGLSLSEARIAKATHLPAQRYATIKAEIANERAATAARDDAFDVALQQRAVNWPKPPTPPPAEPDTTKGP